MTPPDTNLEDVAHIIQVALTPVFLLNGIGTLISVFSTRLARVADQVDRIADKIQDGSAQDGMRVRLARLRLRSLALDIAVILGAMGGAATCCAVVALFVGSLRNAGVASALYVLFGLAVVCTIVALSAFLFEMLLASAGVRRQAEHSEDHARS